MSIQKDIKLTWDWANNSRWRDVKREYTVAEVVNLRGSLYIEHTLARRGAEKLWSLIHTEPFVNALGALTGNQAVQQAKAQGYSATKHQRELGTGYFDAVTQAITGGTSSLTALSGSTEEAQLEAGKVAVAQ